MLTALALAAVIGTSPAPQPIVVATPFGCPSGLWAEPYGEAGYLCAATDPAQEQVVHRSPAPAPVHHAAAKPKHHAKHHVPKHHAAKHRAHR